MEYVKSYLERSIDIDITFLECTEGKQWIELSGGLENIRFGQKYIEHYCNPPHKLTVTTLSKSFLYLLVHLPSFRWYIERRYNVVLKVFHPDS